MLVMTDFSLRRQRRLYLQPSGGWVSSDSAPSHLLPSICPTATSTTNAATLRPLRTKQPIDNKSTPSTKRLCCHRVRVCAARDARQPKVWCPSINQNKSKSDAISKLASRGVRRRVQRVNERKKKQRKERS